MANECIFCKLADVKDEMFVAETGHLYARYDIYPASPGHVMIIPKRHIETHFELNEEEAKEFPILLNVVKSRIEEKRAPKGYNIGSNNGRAAGQVIMHLHIHVIPRYKGGHGMQHLGYGEPKE